MHEICEEFFSCLSNSKKTCYVRSNIFNGVMGFVDESSPCIVIAYGHHRSSTKKVWWSIHNNIDNTCQNRLLLVSKKSAASAEYLPVLMSLYQTIFITLRVQAMFNLSPNWCKMSCPTNQTNLTVAVQNSKQDIHRCTALLSADITIALSFCSVNHKESQTLLIPSTEELRFTLFAGRDMQIVLSCFSVTEVTYIFVTTMGIRQ